RGIHGRSARQLLRSGRHAAERGGTSDARRRARPRIRAGARLAVAGLDADPLRLRRAADVAGAGGSPLPPGARAGPGIAGGTLGAVGDPMEPGEEFPACRRDRRARAGLGRAAELDRAHNRMAAICLHIGRFHEARIAHEASQRSNPKNRTYNLEYIHLYSGDFARAEAAAAAWLREAPDNWFAFCYAVQPPLMTGDLNVAEQRLAAGLKRYPDDPTLLSLEGMLHARRNKTGAALECVRKALDFPITFGHAHHTYYQV